jgi:predicted PurR-regulated permease PerM
VSDQDPAPRPVFGPSEWRASQIIRVTAIVTLTVLVIIGIIEFLSQIRTILLWVVIGVILAIALQPAVGFLVRHRWNRILAALLVSFVTIAALVAVIIVVAYPVVFQADDFIRAMPSLVDNVFGPGGQLHFIETRFQVLERLSSITPEQVTSLLLGNQDTIVTAVTKAASIVAAVITILTIMVMLLIEGPRAWSSILDVMVEGERNWAERIGDNVLRATGGYVRGNLAISFVAGIASYIVLKIMGVPYAETLAVLVAVLDIIPLVGATIGAIIVCIVGFATGGVVDGVVLVVYFVLYQQFENNVLQNIVYSKTVSLSPLIVFVAALVGAALGGIVGVLLAIPITSAAWVLAGDLIALRHARSEQRGGRTSVVDEPPPDSLMGSKPSTP